MRPKKARAQTGFTLKKGGNLLSFYEFLSLMAQVLTLAFTVWAWIQENDKRHNGKGG